MIQIRHCARRVAGLAAGPLIGALLFGSVAAAQIATLDERIAGADDVVVARARTITPEWRENEHGDRIIVSRIVLDVEETLKGDGASSKMLELEGGTLDGYTLRVSTLPMLQPGERGVFFLDRGSSSVHHPHLRGQGILLLGDDDVVRGSSLRLTEIRSRAHGSGW